MFNTSLNLASTKDVISVSLYGERVREIRDFSLKYMHRNVNGMRDSE